MPVHYEIDKYLDDVSNERKKSIELFSSDIIKKIKLFCFMSYIAGGFVGAFLAIKIWSK